MGRILDGITNTASLFFFCAGLGAIWLGAEWLAWPLLLLFGLLGPSEAGAKWD